MEGGREGGQASQKSDRDQAVEYLWRDPCSSDSSGLRVAQGGLTFGCQHTCAHSTEVRWCPQSATHAERQLQRNRSGHNRCVQTGIGAAGCLWHILLFIPSIACGRVRAPVGAGSALKHMRRASKFFVPALVCVVCERLRARAAAGPCTIPATSGARTPDACAAAAPCPTLAQKLQRAAQRT